MREQDRVRDILIDMTKGKSAGQKLVFNPRTKQIANVEPGPMGLRDPDSKIEVVPEDHDLFGFRLMATPETAGNKSAVWLEETEGSKKSLKRNPDPAGNPGSSDSELVDIHRFIEMNQVDTRSRDSLLRGRGTILLNREYLEELPTDAKPKSVSFLCRDDDSYTLLKSKSHHPVDDLAKGIICKFDSGQRVVLSGSICYSTEVIVLVKVVGEINAKTATLEVNGYVSTKIGWERVEVKILPGKNEIFSRFGGLLETDVLSEKKVLICGLGSGGSQIAIELSKASVMNYTIMDHDRLEVGNISRHMAGISDVGRYKTNVMAEMILEKNPYCKIHTEEKKISWDTAEEIREMVRDVDLVICATDGNTSRNIINRICVEESKPCMFPGAFRRAYGGQILFVRPHKTLCYQCFRMHLPDQAMDQEISSPEQAEGLAYTDRPVSIEPGLSADIAPISFMTVKLAIQYFLRGKNTTLKSLDDDLVAPWFIWLNRREVDTQYENLEPLEFNLDGFHILRWYGIDVKPHPACPVCGNFEGSLALEEHFVHEFSSDPS